MRCVNVTIATTLLNTFIYILLAILYTELKTIFQNAVNNFIILFMHRYLTFNFKAYTDEHKMGNF